MHNFLKVLVVQPFFSSSGHPAQTLMNMAHILRGRSDVTLFFLVDNRKRTHLEIAEKIKSLCSCITSEFRWFAPRIMTAVALIRSLMITRRERQNCSIFFEDAHLLVFLLISLMIPGFLMPRRLFVRYLCGPEKYSSHFSTRVIVRRFLKLPSTSIVFRNQEICDAWQKDFPEVPPGKFLAIITPEVFTSPIPTKKAHKGKLKYGLFGQIRDGKSISHLVEIFDQNPDLGDLVIAGSFANEGARRSYSFLSRLDYFTEGYLTTEDLISRARETDYLLLLYDEWDSRMESGNLFLAARAGTPVILYDEGWLGRMHREFGVGIAIPKGEPLSADFFLTVPMPDDHEYMDMLEGLGKFRISYSEGAFAKMFFANVLELGRESVT